MLCGNWMARHRLRRPMSSLTGEPMKAATKWTVHGGALPEEEAHQRSGPKDRRGVLRGIGTHPGIASLPEKPEERTPGRLAYGGRTWRR